MQRFLADVPHIPVHKLGRLPLGIAAVTLLLLSVSVAHAAPVSRPSVSLRPADAQGHEVSGPGYFVLTARPGSTTRLYALVGNNGRASATISLVPVDARSGVYGGISLDLPNEPRRDVGSWVTLGRRSVALKPGKGAVIPLSVRVPARTRPGQYIGGLTAFVPISTRQQRAGLSITVQTRVALGILVTIPGSRAAHLALRGVGIERRPGVTYLIVHLRNSGNTLLKGWGHLWIWRVGSAHPIMDTALTLATTVPQTVVDYPIGWRRGPFPGQYTFSLTVWWKGGQVMQHGSFRVR